jgi:hypothetical protein
LALEDSDYSAGAKPGSVPLLALEHLPFLEREDFPFVFLSMSVSTTLVDLSNLQKPG